MAKVGLTILGLSLWNRTGLQPPNMDDLGEGVWSLKGIRFLVFPSGQKRSCKFTKRRLESEQRLWNAIPSITDLQCAWQLLLQCAGPRCNHLCELFLLPNQRHVRQGTTAANHGGFIAGDHGQSTMAHKSWPMRLRRLGLRSARRLAPAAYWASRSDAMPMLQERVPEATAIIKRELARIPRVV